MLPELQEWLVAGESAPPVAQTIKNIMKGTRTVLVGISILNVALLASQAVSITPAFQPSSTPITVYQGPVNLGTVFTPVENLTVDSLGFYQSPGLTEGEEVGIFDSSGNIVANTFVSLTAPDAQLRFF